MLSMSQSPGANIALFFLCNLPFPSTFTCSLDTVVCPESGHFDLYFLPASKVRVFNVVDLGAIKGLNICLHGCLIDPFHLAIYLSEETLNLFDVDRICVQGYTFLSFHIPQALFDHLVEQLHAIILVCVASIQRFLFDES